jgi:hypothetical protein
LLGPLFTIVVDAQRGSRRKGSQKEWRAPPQSTSDAQEPPCVTRTFQCITIPAKRADDPATEFTIRRWKKADLELWTDGSVTVKDLWQRSSIRV